MTAQYKQASPLRQAHVCIRGQHQRDACAGAPFPPARGNPSGFAGPAAGFNEPHHVHQPLEPGRGRGFAAGRGRSMLPKGLHFLCPAANCTWQLTSDSVLDMHAPSDAGLKSHFAQFAADLLTLTGGDAMQASACLRCLERRATGEGQQGLLQGLPFLKCFHSAQRQACPPLQSCAAAPLPDSCTASSSNTCH